MNNFDLMVGGGISSLLGKEQTDTPGEFDFAAKSNPTVSMAYGGEARSQFEDVYRPEQEAAASPYSDAQVAQALQESMKQGFSLEDSIFGAQTKYGIPTEQLTRAQSLFTPAQQNVVSNLQTAGLQEVPQPPVPTTPVAKTAAGTTLIDAFNYAQQNLGSRPDAISVDVDSIGTPIGVGAKTQFGNYTITALGNPVYENVVTGYDPETGAEIFGQKQVGSDVTGYTIEGILGKTDKGINYESSVTVDKTGKITGSFVDYKTGGDSGIRVWYDANGREIDKQGYDKSERWRKPVALGLSFLGSVVGLPGIGEFLSAGALTGAQAAALGGAALGAGTAAVAGAEGSDILKSAAISGATAGAGAALDKAAIFTGTDPISGGATSLSFNQAVGEIGRNIGQAVGSDAVGNAVTSAIQRAGVTGLGALIGGKDISDAVVQGLVQGGVSGITSGVSGKYLADIPKPLRDAATAAATAAAMGKDPKLAAFNALVSSAGRSIKGASTQAAPIGDEAGRTASYGSPFETSAIFEGTEGGGTSEQDFMGLLGTLGDQAGDYPGQEAGPRMFNAAGQMIAAPSGEFIDLPDGRYIDDRGVIFKPDGTPWSPSGTATDPFAATGNIIGKDQKVDISGEPFRSREDIALDYFFYPGEDKPMYDEAGQRIVVTGKPYMEEGDATDLGQIEIVGKPYQDVTDLGKIDIVGKPYEEDQPPGVIEGPDKIDIVSTPIKDLGIGTVDPLDLSDIIKSLKDIVIPTPPGTTTPATTPGTRTSTPTKPTTKAAQTAALAAAASNLYALPGDLPLFKSVFYEMERQKELARQAKEIENADRDPYEILMELAEENPGMAVDELMQIIEGGQRG